MSRKFEELKSWCAEKIEEGQKPLALARRICHRQLGDPKHPLNGTEMAEIILGLLDKGLRKNAPKKENIPHPRKAEWEAEAKANQEKRRLAREAKLVEKHS